jgi:hypothetical protein
MIVQQKGEIICKQQEVFHSICCVVEQEQSQKQAEVHQKECGGLGK